jgi:hypothetical protein
MRLSSWTNLRRDDEEQSFGDGKMTESQFD